jgi:hypothetical protein
MTQAFSASSPTTGELLRRFIQSVSTAEEQHRLANNESTDSGAFIRMKELLAIKELVTEVLDQLRQSPDSANKKELLNEIDKRADCLSMISRMERSHVPYPIENNDDRFSCILHDFLFIGGGGHCKDFGFMVPNGPGSNQTRHYARITKFVKSHNIKFILNVSQELMPTCDKHQRQYVVHPSKTFMCQEKDDLKHLSAIPAEALPAKDLQSVVAVFVPMPDIDAFSSEVESLVATAALALEIAWQRYAASIVRFPSQAPPRCFLHCVGGLNRSPFTAVYWLVHYHGVSVEKAWHFVSSLRARNVDRAPLNSLRNDGKTAWRCGLQQSCPVGVWPHLGLEASLIKDVQCCIQALQNDSAVSLSHVVRDDHPPWSPLLQQHHQPPSQQEEAGQPLSVPVNEEEQQQQHQHQQRLQQQQQQQHEQQQTQQPQHHHHQQQQQQQLQHQHQLAQPLGHQLSFQPVHAIMQQQLTVNPAAHRSSSITSMLSSKVAVQRLPLGVTRADVESFLTQLNVSGLKSCQFDSHGTNAVLDFCMPQFAQECVMRVDAQRMRASDPETLKVSLYEATKLEPGKILIAERYEKDVPISIVSKLFRNIPNFKGTCKPNGASYCFAEFVDSTSCASALNKAHATSSEVYFRYVSQIELLKFQSARQKEREEAVRQFQAAENNQRLVPPAHVIPPKQPQSSPAPASSSSSSNYPSVVLLTCSGIPFDISLDNLKRRMSLYSGCLANTLRNRECTKGDAPSSLRFQELQVQFQHETSANECLNTMNGRPFMDDRPEYGPVKVGVKKSKNLSPILPDVTPVPSVPPSVSKHSSSTNVSQTNSSNMPVPWSQSSADWLIFLVTNNIPTISQEEISRKFMDAPGFLGSKVEIRPDPKAPGTNSVKCLFVDHASAQRCLDSMAGRPFSPHHEIGPVRGYVKQVSKELMMQEKQKRKQAQLAQMPPQPSEASFASQQHEQMLHDTPDLRENVSSVPPSISVHSSPHTTPQQRVVAVQQYLPPPPLYSPMHYPYTMADADMVFTPAQQAMSALQAASVPVACVTIPRGLSLKGLSEEERAALLSMPERLVENPSE